MTVSTTTVIILAKQPFKESGLLVRGITPDNYGGISLVAHGAQKVSEKHLPEIDLFREIEVEFNDDETQQQTLFTCNKTSLLNSFDSIADNQRHYKMAMAISSFVLKNSQPYSPLTYTYDTLLTVFSHLASADSTPGIWTLEQISVVLKVAFLCDNGMIPEAKDPAQNQFIEDIIAAGIGTDELPTCQPDYWNKLNLWLNYIIEKQDLKR